MSAFRRVIFGQMEMKMPRPELPVVRRAGRLAALCLLVLVTHQVVAAPPASPAELAEAYLRAVTDSDWQVARSLWSTADLERSLALGIRYTGQPFKLDSASPLVLEHARRRAGLIRVAVAGIDSSDTFCRIRFRLDTDGATAVATYYTIPTDDGWRLTTASSALAATWSRIETGFLDLRVQPPLMMSQQAVRTLDRFVAATCERLAVAPDRVELLRSRKLGYLLCDEATVAEIVGAPTRGAALLQTDAVVTSEPCHLHELAHLIVNFALQELPLYTLPFMQEGTAVALGGRWGRGPEVMQGLGRFTLNGGLLEVEELLTWDGFSHNMPDLTYAPSGVLAGYLLDLLGGARFVALYRQLSGDLSDLERIDLATVQQRVSAAVGMSWPELRSDLDRHLERLSCGGILPAEGDGPDAIAHLQDGGQTVTITGDDLWLHWSIEAAGGEVAGAVLLHDADADRRPDAFTPPSSRLFAEQFPGRAYAGESMALVFTPEEVGLYDFRTDLLLVKFVAGFCPDRSLNGAGGGGLAFRVRRDLFPVRPWQAELITSRR